MDRHDVLEMCLVSLLVLPEAELVRLLPTLAMLADPYLASLQDHQELCQSIRRCLAEHLV